MPISRSPKVPHNNTKTKHLGPQERKESLHYNIKNEGPERKEIAVGISSIFLDVTRCYSGTYLSADDLAQLGIDVSSMSMSTGKSDEMKDSFFKPLSPEVLEKEWASVDHDIKWPEPTFFVANNFYAADWVNELVWKTTKRVFKSAFANWTSRKYILFVSPLFPPRNELTMRL